jgi:hypothetical protein
VGRFIAHHFSVSNFVPLPVKIVKRPGQHATRLKLPLLELSETVEPLFAGGKSGVTFMLAAER